VIEDEDAVLTIDGIGDLDPGRSVSRHLVRRDDFMTPGGR
jgi:hypothetical protein